MTTLLALLRQNRNYRYTWMGQVVSEIGDHFNNIAVFALVMEKGGSGLVVSGVMLSRAIPAVLAGPVAGVVLDRLARKRIMIASDLIRAVLALAFVLTIHQPRPWLLYLLSAALMFASPFFTSGRAARLGYHWAFVLNSLSFVFSAGAIWRVSVRGGFRVKRHASAAVVRPWHEYREGLVYMRSVPLMMGIALISVGWAMGGGAAQILFALFGEQVFHRGASRIGAIWGFAGIGLLLGGTLGHLTGRHTGFAGYKRAVTISYLAHGAAYMLFSQVESFAAALVSMMFSRVGMAVTTVLNNFQLLRHTPDQYRGRVFATMESLRWSVMIVSMAAAASPPSTPVPGPSAWSRALSARSPPSRGPVSIGAGAYPSRARRAPPPTPNSAPSRSLIPRGKTTGATGIAHQADMNLGKSKCTPAPIRTWRAPANSPGTT